MMFIVLLNNFDHPVYITDYFLLSLTKILFKTNKNVINIIVTCENYFGALDLGSSHCTLLICKINQQYLNILANAQIDSKGIRKGAILNKIDACKCLKAALDTINIRENEIPRHWCVAQSGSHINTLHYVTTLPLNGLNHVFKKADVEAVDTLGMNKPIPKSDIYLHQFKQYYSIDNNVVDNPIDHVGNQLGVHYCACIGDIFQVKQSIYVPNQFGFNVKELVFSGLASALATTTEIERTNGVCAIDIGAEITDFIVFKNNKPLLMGTVPVGGKNFTYDMCSGLGIDFSDAERIKLEHGIPSTESDANEEEFWIIGNKAIGDKKIKTKNLRIILQARAKELLDIICKQINSTIGLDNFPFGIIITGGGSLLKNIEKISADVFKKDTYVRSPLTLNSDTLKYPSYSTCAGLITFLLQQSNNKSKEKTLLKKIASWFS